MEPGDSSLEQPSELCMPDPSGKHKKGKKKMRDQRKSQSLEEPITKGPRNPPLSRSKTYDPSFSKEVEKETGSTQQGNSISSLKKHSVNFHRAFKDLPEEEALLDTFSCAWQRELPYHGRLYISHNHLGFYCSMLRRKVKVIIPVATVSVLKKANTALLVPNAISIRTAEGEKFVFGSLRSREMAYQLLRSVCKHLEDGSWIPNPATSPNMPEDLLKISLTSGQLDHNPAEDEMLPEKSDGAIEQEKLLKTSAERELAAPSRGREQPKTSLKGWWVHLSSFHMIISIYLFLAVVLLLSSGYIGLRIVQLEEQLTSMGAWPELDLQQPYQAS